MKIKKESNENNGITINNYSKRRTPNVYLGAGVGFGYEATPHAQGHQLEDEMGKQLELKPERMCSWSCSSKSWLAGELEVELKGELESWKARELETRGRAGASA